MLLIRNLQLVFINSCLLVGENIGANFLIGIIEVIDVSRSFAVSSKIWLANGPPIDAESSIGAIN